MSTCSCGKEETGPFKVVWQKTDPDSSAVAQFDSDGHTEVTYELMNQMLTELGYEEVSFEYGS